ncbi:hypothetical protein [Pasteurella phage PMP-GADVASU-IND]|nr:hypothetical protein [Pasteurella phage PMP-GADVASU-IND]
MTTKTCTKCGVAKPLAAFHKDKTGKFGRCPSCKECVAAYQRAYRESNREKINAYARAYRESNREKVRDNQRAWHEANREKRSAQNRAWYEANREKRSAQNRARKALMGAPHIDKWQEISLKHATRDGDLWSEEEDRYLATSTNRAIDDALALQRTYNAVNARRTHLIAAGVIEKQCS